LCSREPRATPERYADGVIAGVLREIQVLKSMHCAISPSNLTHLVEDRDTEIHRDAVFATEVRQQRCIIHFGGNIAKIAA